jgi:uncharacterized DUF497 family protein
MKVTWEENKRDWTLIQRSLDFSKFPELFEQPYVLVQDTRKEYGEDRFVVTGYLNGDLIVAAFTVRKGSHRIFSMRKANKRERSKIKKILHR